MAARSGILGLGSRLYPGNMQRISNKDLTRLMQSLSRECQNRASKRKALLAGWDFESILEEILLDRGQGNLKLKPKQKEALQAIVFERSRLFNCRSNCRITETNA